MNSLRSDLQWKLTFEDGSYSTVTAPSAKLAEMQIRDSLDRGPKVKVELASQFATIYEGEDVVITDCRIHDSDPNGKALIVIDRRTGKQRDFTWRTDNIFREAHTDASILSIQPNTL